MPFKQNVIQRIQENDPRLTLIGSGAWSDCLTEADIEVLTDAIKFSKNTFLNTLDLNENDSGDEGALFLSSLEAIKNLKIADNGITSVGAEYLKEMKSLSSLDVSLNEIGDDGFAALVKNTSIVSLTACRCGITSQGAEAVLNNTHIFSLALEGNDIEEKVLEKIDAHIARNRQKAASSPVIPPSSRQFWSDSPVKQVLKESNIPAIKSDDIEAELLKYFNEYIQKLNDIRSKLPSKALKEYPEYQHTLREIVIPPQHALGKKY